MGPTMASRLRWVDVDPSLHPFHAGGLVEAVEQELRDGLAGPRPSD